jgi:lipopolysaccharide biosynthesis protein
LSEAPRPLWKRVLRHPARAVLRASEIAASLVYVTAPFQALRERRLERRTAAATVRAAVVAHVYYPELWEEIRAVHATLPAGAGLIVTAPPAQAALVAELAGSDPFVEIIATPNRGRDIAPFLQALQSGVLDRFDAVLKVHTKKSPHLMLGDLRRRFFFTALAGSPAITASILRQFEDPRTGIVGPRPFFRAAPAYWMGNRARVEELTARIGTAPALGFFEGSMFWVRPAALRRLRALGLRAEDFDEESGQLDATLHHAIERLFPLAAAADGYETRAIGGGRLF